MTNKRSVTVLIQIYIGVECGEVGGVLPPHLKVLVVSREVGGRAVFTCDPGYGLKGPQETVCQANGDWGTPFPTCEGLLCVSVFIF